MDQSDDQADTAHTHATSREQSPRSHMYKDSASGLVKWASRSITSLFATSGNGQLAVSC